MPDRIGMDPEVLLGKPVIRGTRVPVELILRKLSEGATEPDLLDAYPRLTHEDILAALAFAADTIAHDEMVPAGPSPRRAKRPRVISKAKGVVASTRGAMPADRALLQAIMEEERPML